MQRIHFDARTLLNARKAWICERWAIVIRCSKFLVWWEYVFIPNLSNVRCWGKISRWGKLINYYQIIDIFWLPKVTPHHNVHRKNANILGLCVQTIYACLFLVLQLRALTVAAAASGISATFVLYSFSPKKTVISSVMQSKAIVTKPREGWSFSSSFWGTTKLQAAK